MTEVQLILLMGTIWVAPYCDPNAAVFIGGCCFMLAVSERLGWV